MSKIEKLKIVYLVAIIEKDTEYEDVKNYLFKNRKDAINLIEKHYYLKPVKGSIWLFGYGLGSAIDKLMGE